MPIELKTTDKDFETRFGAFLARKREAEKDVGRAVAEIIADVRARGDAALIDYTRRFDHMDLNTSDLCIPTEGAAKACDRDVLDALRLAAERIEAFHRRQLSEDVRFTDDDGIELGYRWRAIEAAGIYVPGGLATYPSSVLMNAIPARVAGVDRIVMTVPTPQGKINPLVLAAADICGVDEVYRVGGAQAVAALAYGTETIRPVDKIVGPGNAFVAEAKRQVFGAVGIDMIAGPSEILVVADESCRPDWVAADLLSQAEHDASAQSILITESAELAASIVRELEKTLAGLERREVAEPSWRDFGAVILVPTLDDAVPLIDRIAPEHLELAVANPEPLFERIRNAGAIFLGHYTPEAIGDYVAGPNHVLPTGRSARFSSGLSTFDFLKRTTFVRCDADSMERIGAAAERLANAEGLGAHALSVRLRRRANES